MVSVDLPTPPLPEAMQTTLETWASAPSGSDLRPSSGLERGLLLVVEDVEADVDVGDAVELAHGVADRRLEGALDRAAGRGQRDGDVHHAAGVHVDRADHVQLDDVAPQLRVDDVPERVSDLLGAGITRYSSRAD